AAAGKTSKRGHDRPWGDFPNRGILLIRHKQIPGAVDAQPVGKIEARVEARPVRTSGESGEPSEGRYRAGWCDFPDCVVEHVRNEHVACAIDGYSAGCVEPGQAALPIDVARDASQSRKSADAPGRRDFSNRLILSVCHIHGPGAVYG